MRVQTRSSLTRKLDKECSRIIRSYGSCQFCGKSEYDHLECCHIYSRKSRSVRWNLLNLLCLCDSCHFESHAKPIMFAEKVREILGEYNYQQLKVQANSIKKWTVEEMSELLESLRRVE